MLVILGIGVLLNYLRELSNMKLNEFEREFFSGKKINNVCCEHIIYGYVTTQHPYRKLLVNKA